MLDILQCIICIYIFITYSLQFPSKSIYNLYLASPLPRRAATFRGVLDDKGGFSYIFPFFLFSIKGSHRISHLILGRGDIMPKFLTFAFHVLLQFQQVSSKKKYFVGKGYDNKLRIIFMKI